MASKEQKLWLALGDMNSGFFHATTRQRWAINKISVLEDTQGNAVFEEHKIMRVISDYFESLFKLNSSEAT